MTLFYPAWPYAVKATIQHEWHADHLHLWLTFRLPMDQTVKPGHDLWILDADDTPRAIVASAWQDPYTLLLTSTVFDGPPARVLLEYDGPSPTLRATWEKQWEPWGPILSIDITS